MLSKFQASRHSIVIGRINHLSRIKRVLGELLSLRENSNWCFGWTTGQIVNATPSYISSCLSLISNWLENKSYQPELMCSEYRNIRQNFAEI